MRGLSACTKANATRAVTGPSCAKVTVATFRGSELVTVDFYHQRMCDSYSCLNNFDFAS